MDLNALAALVKVVQTGSFTRAAEALHTQKAHLSRVISQLERQLGVRLLERTTRALSLTEIGREVHERALGILAAVEDTERVAQAMLAEPKGVMRLTASVDFGRLAVSRWINAFLASWPAARVDADFTGRVVDIVHEGFDLAIRVGNLPDSSLAARRLGELEYGLYANPAYLSRRGSPASPEALAGHDLLVFASGRHRGSWRLQRQDVQRKIMLDARLRVNHSYAARDAALRDLGIARLPRWIAAEAVAGGTLVAVLPDWASPPAPVHAVFPGHRYLTPKVRAFIDLAVADFSRGGSPRPNLE
jgi:DNA-binding transcriptional LysR family regulator